MALAVHTGPWDLSATGQRTENNFLLYIRAFDLSYTTACCTVACCYHYYF